MIFQKITLADRGWMESRLAESDFRGSEYCFTNSFNWREVYGVEVGQTDGMLVVKCTKPVVTYAFPAGKGDLRRAIETVQADAVQAGVPLLINCISDESKQQLEQLFPDRFIFTYDRDSCDYLYDRDSLTTLAGKKLQNKRNHINKFRENFPDWRYEIITPENLTECSEMNARWCQKYGCEGDEGLFNESCAVKSAFKNFPELRLTGGLLRCTPHGEVVAYSMGTPLNSDTFIVHIEKAYQEIQGAYQMINQQFVLHNCQQFVYVNREDDTGGEGLRKAKLSYRPILIPHKYTAVLGQQS